MKQQLNILFPGGFKPVHAGHLYMIKDYLEGDPENNTKVYVIISNKTRDGITAQSSYDFLNKVFSGYQNFNCIITGYPSPIKAAYQLTATKEFGDGLYALASSNKDDDIKRSLDFERKFNDNGDYYTPGIKPAVLFTEAVPLYITRHDDFNQTPISSTVMREDIMIDDYAGFLSAYETPYLRGFVDEATLKEYYDILCNEINTPLHESGAAGHLNHPYENNDLTFSEIKDMIESLFMGKIEDITEKIDGINLMASVDQNGKTIFARNRSNMLTTPMSINDMMNNNQWDDTIRNSFVNGAKTIEKVFNNIKDKIRFFNYDDKLDGLRYRNWVSVEIVDHEHPNVIPYVENFVSFHSNIITVCTKYIEGEESQSVFDDPNIDKDNYQLIEAIKKTKIDGDEYKAIITPRMIFKQCGEQDILIEKNINDLNDLMEEYGMNDDNTINDYRYAAYYKYILNNSPIKYLSYEDMEKLAERWSNKKKVNIREFDSKDSDGVGKIIMKSIRDYEKDNKWKLDKRVMLPIDKFFINLGNDVMKLVSGGKNDDNKPAAIKKIRKSIIDAINSIEETGDLKNLEKLEYTIFRIGDIVDVNASEGIVFKYNGRFYKLTGSFAAFNQIINLSKHNKKATSS